MLKVGKPLADKDYSTCTGKIKNVRRLISGGLILFCQNEESDAEKNK